MENCKNNKKGKGNLLIIIKWYNNRINTDAAALVTATDNYGYSDPYHYNTPGYLDLGRRFAEALLNLRQR